jgi:hypothetical protein
LIDSGHLTALGAFVVANLKLADKNSQPRKASKVHMAHLKAFLLSRHVKKTSFQVLGVKIRYQEKALELLTADERQGVDIKAKEVAAQAQEHAIQNRNQTTPWIPVEMPRTLMLSK